MLKKLFMLGLLVFVIGCKADIVEFKITEKKLEKALRGREETIQFEAIFTQYGDLEREDKQRIKQIEEELSQYIDIDDIDIDKNRHQFRVFISGEIPIYYNQRRADDAWYFLITDNRRHSIDYPYELELKTGRQFSALQATLRNMHHKVRIGAFQPVQFNLRGNGLNILAPATQANGRYFKILEEPVYNTLRIKQEGGIYDHINSGFYFRF